MVGTGRCGTAYAARRLSDVGIPCSHERYYTPDGPKRRNPMRPYRARGDVSWLAVPFLAPGSLPVVHLVREPLAVIGSLFNIGFFDPRWRAAHAPFIRFAEQHFRVGSDPFDNCVRWYLEWNLRCERLAGLHVPIERFEEMLPTIADYIGTAAKQGAPPPSTSINSRPSVLAEPVSRSEVAARLGQHSCGRALFDMAARYGYRSMDSLI